MRFRVFGVSGVGCRVSGSVFVCGVEGSGVWGLGWGSGILWGLG